MDNRSLAENSNNKKCLLQNHTAAFLFQNKPHRIIEREGWMQCPSPVIGIITEDKRYLLKLNIK